MGTAVKCTSAGKRQQMHFAASFIVPYNRMSCPTNEPDVDFSVLRTLKIDENIRNPLIFLRKMATCIILTLLSEIVNLCFDFLFKYLYQSLRFHLLFPLRHHPADSACFLR